MNADHIINAIGSIDEELIDGCDRLRSSYKFKSGVYIKWISVAASLILVGLVAAYFMLKPEGVKKTKQASNVKEPIIHTEIPEDKQVAVKPSDTPQATVEPTAVPKSTVCPTEVLHEPTAQPTENVSEPTVSPETDWEDRCTMFLARLEPETGKGFKIQTGNNATSEMNSATTGYTDEFFINNSEWKFEFYLNNGLYAAQASVLTEVAIDQYLGEANVNIYEIALSDLSFTKALPIYSIKFTNSDAAVAIKAEEHYYLFRNVRYDADNLSEFIASYNLKNTVDIKQSGWYDKSKDKLEYADIKEVTAPTVFWDTLLSIEECADFIEMENTAVAELCVIADSKFYGFYDMPIYFYENGNVIFRFFGQSYLYNIGEEGYKLIYDLTRGD